jgi:penicillin-binding protein 1B
MPKKRRSPRAVKRTRRSSGFLAGGLKRWTLWLLLPAIVLFLVYLAYLDHTVRQQFEGKRWSLPARVYADPLELYAGYAIGADRFEAILEQLKYRSDATLSSGGSFHRRGNEIALRTRAFQFSDKSEPARQLRLRFSGNSLRSVEDLETSADLPIMRLEPVQIGSFYPKLREDRILIKLEQAPKQLLQGLFSTEDHDFYEHHGLSAKAILRAVWANVRARGVVQGGSTLTQQLVKNFYLSSERSLWRKFNEALMALLLERHYSKNEILEAYLNEIYLGQDGARAIHGFGLASNYYFSRSLDELELRHIALLVALVRGPSYYDPLTAPARAKKRRDLALDAMAEQGYISRLEADAVKQQALDVVKDPHQSISRYPAFLDLVRRQLQQEYRDEDLTSEGLRIFTTLDIHVQQQLEASIARTLKKLDQRSNGAELETAALITRRANGGVAALAGARDPQETGFNRVLDSVRQIGSLYKPVVYLTALQRPADFTLVTPLQDRAIRVKSGKNRAWSPKNYDHREHGQVALHTALAHSYNLATVRLGLNVGLAQTVKTLRKLGVNRKVELVPSLLLGTGALTPFEVAQMYQTLAGDGFITPLRAIQSVVSSEGKPLQRYPLSVRQTLNPASVYLVNTILQEAVREGTGRSVYAYLPQTYNVVGKTGTTNDLRDSWFAGFTGDYVGVVWVGRDDNQSARLTGAQGALHVWAQVMRRISQEPVLLTPPDDIELVWIDQSNGLRTSESCPQAAQYPFIAGSAPQQLSSCSEMPDDGSWSNGMF